jgi:ABC-type Zn uptake system ZnuABC Zn-binding protein ZnuA
MKRYTNNIKRNMQDEIRKKAKINLHDRLESQGLTADSIPQAEYERLLRYEIELLNQSVKEVGVGLAVGSILTMFLGF